MNPRIFFNIFLHTVIISILIVSASSGQNDLVKGNLIQFIDNGAWCWYQDERAVIDPVNNKLILGSDASNNGTGGSQREGDVEVIIFDLETHTIQKSTLKDGSTSPSTFYADDHNAPAFLVRPDGKYIAMYAAHFGDTSSHYRIYENNQWGTEQLFNWKQQIPGGSNFQTTYSNIYYLSAEGRMYNFVRGNNKSPNSMVSTDMGNTWSYGGQLTTSGNVGYNNGYYRYWGNGVDRIDFIFTEAHPRDFFTSIYHGYIKDGKSYKSDGTLVDDNILDQNDISLPADYTLVFADNTMIEGNAMRRCWNTDVVRYDDGIIATIITARANQYTGSDNSINPDHRFIYCRYNGSNWTYTYLGKAGPKLYGSEADYTGLAAIHPNDKNTIYISTTIDPRDDSDLGVHEIFKGVTSNNGVTWTWTSITQNSSRDNLRPIIPFWDENNIVLLWMRGTYLSAQNFDMTIVGIVERNSETIEKMNYVDASSDNTSLATSETLVTTGPDANTGADDNQWHERTGYGNGGSVLTSSETGNGENSPTIKTQVIVQQSGTYDVWVNFWANPSADWRIKAGLSEDGMQLFRHMACKQVEDGDHNTTMVLSGSGNTFLYQAYLGRVQVSAGGTFDIFVDDEAIQTGTLSTSVGDVARTWYDGISYSGADDFVPVELTSFTAVQNGSSIQLQWGTASEINNHGFEIEKQIKKDDKFGDWYVIAFKEGKGTSSEPVNYIYEDNNIDYHAYSMRYRLKQIDYDGTFKYSDIVEVKNISPIDFTLAQNYPNPFNPVTTIKYGIPVDNFVSLKVYNVVGEEVVTLVYKEMPAGYYTINWNAGNLPSGIYLYHLSSGNHLEIKKMMLLK